jgi:general secretion pathway protein D
VQADPSTNSLVITAPQPLYRQVREVIDQLDARRSQVYVEALIVEMDADKAAELGVQWQGAASSSGSTAVVAGTSYGSGLSNILGLSLAASQGTSTLASSDLSSLNGLNVAVVQKIAGTYTLGALARALQTQTGANVLSTPNLVTLDNEEAKIVVGQNVPFITGSYTTSSTTTSPFQTVERKDVGLTLRVRPQIGEGSTVRMTIFQESSAVLSTTAAGTTNAGPSTSKRSIESTVVVDDGQMLVLGGLIEDSSSDTRSQVPLLGDLPWVGGLFRTDTRSHKKTNLMVFLRPIVMKTQAAASALSSSRYQSMREAQEGAPSRSLPLLPADAAPTLPQDATTLPAPSVR